MYNILNFKVFVVLSFHQLPLMTIDGDMGSENVC